MESFDILGKVGEGAFAAVYKVKRKDDCKIYALKRVKEMINSLNQIRILASISSPYILKYREAFYEEKTGSLCIITEFAEGGDLYGLINDKKRKRQMFKEEDIWRVAFQILKGLQVLHSLNIFHRDIKSANILLNKDHSIAKLADMNVSIVAKSGLAFTQAGTPYYASPQVWSEKPYNSKSDIWSLGCVLYEMAALKVPFVANDIKQLKKKITLGQLQRIPKQYSPELQKFIQLCLTTNVKDRPTIDELLNNHFTSSSYSCNKQNNNPNKLLATILPPMNKNFKFLQGKLPKSNYREQSLQNLSMINENKQLKLPKLGRPNSLQQVTNKPCIINKLRY